jgi:hypothetical protein
MRNGSDSVKNLAGLGSRFESNANTRKKMEGESERVQKQGWCTYEVRSSKERKKVSKARL